MIIGPSLCSIDFYNYEQSPFPRYSSSSSRGEKKKKNTRLLYSSLSSNIDCRASAVSITRFFSILACRGPAVSLNTSGIARPFSIFFFFFAALSPNRVAIPTHFFWLCSAARPTEPSLDSRFSVIEQISNSPSLLTPRFCQEQESVSLDFFFAQRLDRLSRELN